MVTDSFRGEALAVANRQADRTDDELLELLEYEWERAGLTFADRGVGDYLRTVREELLGVVLRERGTVEVINAMLADNTLNWAAQHHLASDQYAFVVGLLVAWVTRSALRRPSEPHNKDDENDQQP